MDDELAAALREGLHPAGHLHPLVDGLGVAVQLADPVDGALRALGASWLPGAATETPRPSMLRGLGLPEVDLEIALVLERGVEHALRRHDPAGADLVRRAVGHQGDLVPVRLEAEGELETGLAGSDDEYLPHGGALLCVLLCSGDRALEVAASGPGRRLLGRGLERVADQGEQRLDHRDPLPRVHDHDGYVRRARSAPRARPRLRTPRCRRSG